MTNWPKIKSRRTTRISPWMEIIEREVEFTAGSQSQLYHSVAQQDYIAIVALTPDGQIPIVRQYRPALERFTWELPAGMVEKGEDPAKTCRRELLEETGYSAGRWRHLATLFPCVGYSNEKVELFLAQQLSHDGHPGEDGEVLECIRLGLDEALTMVTVGEITEAKTILGLLWADKLRKGEWK